MRFPLAATTKPKARHSGGKAPNRTSVNAAGVFRREIMNFSDDHKVESKALLEVSGTLVNAVILGH